MAEPADEPSGGRQSRGFGALSLDVRPDGVGVVTFARPPVNAVSLSVYEDIGRLCDHVADSSAVRVLILTAPEDAKAWCGGADLNDFVGMDTAGRKERYAYINAQLPRLSALDCPVIQGSTPNREREALYDAFRRGEVPRLVVSKVANFSVDLPEASVAVQVSGTFGSRQEEAQRLGRLLRPKGDGRQAWFYSVVSRDTVDTEYAAHRQRFLAEQGYAYRIVDADDLLGPAIPDKG